MISATADGPDQLKSEMTRFVIVDDEILIARDLATQVRACGYEVVGVVPSLSRAMALIEEHRPDIVLMDIQLGEEQDGIDGAERIRAQFRIPCIFVTAYSDEQTLLRAQHTHPLGYILKPFRSQEVRATLLMAIAQHGLAKSVEENRSWLRTMLLNVPDGVIATDASGYIRFINPTGERMLDVSADQLSGREVEQALQLRAGVLAHGHTGTHTGRAVLRGKGGRETVVEYTCTDVLPEAGTLAGRLLLLRDISERDRIEKLLARERALLTGQVASAGEELDRTKEELRRLSVELMEAQDAERRRIARDLHDDLAQQLVVIEFELGRVTADWPPGSADGIAGVQQRLADASNYVRTISHQLHPAIIDDLGLPVALRQMFDDFREREESPVRFHNKANSLTLPIAVASGVFRIAQEAMRNISKHAHGSATSVSLSWARQSLRLSIRDYGPGFDAADVRYRKGLGLISMQERARAINGTLSIRSIPGTGTLLVLKVGVPSPN